MKKVLLKGKSKRTEAWNLLSEFLEKKGIECEVHSPSGKGYYKNFNFSIHSQPLPKLVKEIRKKITDKGFVVSDNYTVFNGSHQLGKIEFKNK